MLAERAPSTLVLLCLGLVSGCALHIVFAQAGRGSSIHARGLDDAYISFRYAENLVGGHGLVYNLGERVEGYSNLLFVLGAATLLPLVGRDGIYGAVSALNVALALGALLLLHRHTAQRSGPRAALIAAAMLAASPSLWEWSASGMESIAVLLVQIFVWRSLDEADAHAGTDTTAPLLRLVIGLGAATLLRADGFTLTVFAAAYLVWVGRVRLASRMVLWCVPVNAALFSWRYLYYGSPWPNTYYAKVAGPLSDRVLSALEQLWGLMLHRSYWLCLLVVLYSFVTSLPARGGRDAQRTAGPFLVMCLVAYWIFIGGDPFGERFLLLAIPVAAFLVARRVIATRDSWVRGLALAAVVLAQLGPLALWPRFRYGPPLYDGWITLGKELEEAYPGRTLAVDAAGKIPFFSGLPTIDMRGLTDRHIASVEVDRFVRAGHDKLDPVYVLSWEPELIASWIFPGLDIAAGIPRERYHAAGYRVVWLVNATTRPKSENRLRVEGLPAAELEKLIARGYRLALLSR